MMFKTALFATLAAVGSVSAWAPVPLGQRATSVSGRSTRSTTRLYNDQENRLRQEIADRNTVVPDEELYAVADGEGLERDDIEMPLAAASTSSSVSSLYTAPNGAATVTETATETAAATATATETATATVTIPPPVAVIPLPPIDKTSLAARMERLTRPRAYPLFLAEKAAEIVEATVADFSKMMGATSSTSTDYSTSTNGATKERVVILGTGWGAASYLKDVDTDLYDVTVISPRNYFLFTPMLAGASVGTVDFRSICEPIRELNRKAEFLEATALEIDPAGCTVTCESVVCDGNECTIDEFKVPYDRLIVTIGAQTNTFGIPGVREHCCFLRQVEDARRVRNAIVSCFERANLPSLTDEERKQNLTFCVIGAGPTGIEFAAELRDFVEEDGPKYYPNLLKFVRIKVIEASSTVLAPFDKTLQEEAIKQLNRKVGITDIEARDLLPERFKLTELLLDSSVKEVTKSKIYLNDGSEIPYGLSLWAAGNGPIPLTLQLIEALGEDQAKEQDVARGRVAIDPWMRTVGSQGKILAFGDCTCITQGQLPATAQVASQQGEYLAKMMNRKFDLSPALSEEGIFPPPLRDPARTTESKFSDAIANFATNNNDEFAKPFQFLNLGILAYTGGGSALAQVPFSPNAPPIKGTGQIGNALWRSVYLSKQVSWRNRFMVVNDWTKRQLFGRDVTRL
jgi:NADH dehydrogenase FAD-containing subunit